METLLGLVLIGVLWAISRIICTASDRMIDRLGLEAKIWNERIKRRCAEDSISRSVERRMNGEG